MSQLLGQMFQFMSTWFGPSSKPTPVPVPPSTGSPVVAAINAARAGQGLAALVEDESLDGLSRSWAASMAAAGVLQHGDFAGRIASIYPNSAASENIAEGQPDATSVVNAWMSDPPHRANILGAYNRVGVGTARDASSSIYWCADFVRIV